MWCSVWRYVMWCVTLCDVVCGVMWCSACYVCSVWRYVKWCVALCDVVCGVMWCGVLCSIWYFLHEIRKFETVFTLGIQDTGTENPPVRMSSCMWIAHNNHKTTIQVHCVNVMTYPISLRCSVWTGDTWSILHLAWNTLVGKLLAKISYTIRETPTCIINW